MLVLRVRDGNVITIETPTGDKLRIRVYDPELENGIYHIRVALEAPREYAIHRDGTINRERKETA